MIRMKKITALNTDYIGDFELFSKFIEKYNINMGCFEDHWIHLIANLDFIKSPEFIKAKWNIPNIPHKDHVMLFQDNDGKRYLVSQPYIGDVSDSEWWNLTQREIIDFATEYNLTCDVLLKEKSWYYPNQTNIMVWHITDSRLKDFRYRIKNILKPYLPEKDLKELNLEYENNIKLPICDKLNITVKCNCGEKLRYVASDVLARKVDTGEFIVNHITPSGDLKINHLVDVISQPPIVKLTCRCDKCYEEKILTLNLI